MKARLATLLAAAAVALAPARAAERADSFMLVSARHDTLRVATDPAGLTFAPGGEWFVKEPADGGIKIFAPARGKYLGDFGLGERVALTESADSAAVFAIEHSAAGPVALKSPSGAWLHTAGNIGRLHIRKDGENLRIAANSERGRHVIYDFRRCMANELYTFYRVGLANTPRPDAEEGVEWLNISTSDNIGPYDIYRTDNSADGSAGWAGGGHTPGGAQTARTDSVFITADGLTPGDGEDIYCRSVEIRVFNTIFDPRAMADNTETPATLLTEEVTYRVGSNAIAVELKQRWRGSCLVNLYYGMQSMFLFEKEIYTPGGAYPKWTPQAECRQFSKIEYPKFNRFVEKNRAGAMQSTWLRPSTPFSSHSGIGGWSAIFKHEPSYGKSYHVLLNQAKIAEGDERTWTGIYSWHDVALAATDSLTAYQIELPDSVYVVADFHGACSARLALPARYRGAEFRTVGLSPDSTAASAAWSGDSLAVSADGPGSIILGFATKPGHGPEGGRRDFAEGVTDSEALWFMVSDPDAYLNNRPYFSGYGDAIDSAGALTESSPWAEARRLAAEELARAEERGVKETCRRKLAELLDSTATADFGSEDISSLMTALFNASQEIKSAPVDDSRLVRFHTPYIMRLANSGLYLNMETTGVPDSGSNACVSPEPSVTFFSAEDGGWEIRSTRRVLLNADLNGAAADSVDLWQVAGRPDTIATPYPVVTFSRQDGKGFLGVPGTPGPDAPLHTDVNDTTGLIHWELIPAEEFTNMNIYCVQHNDTIARISCKIPADGPRPEVEVPASIGKVSDSGTAIELRDDLRLFKLANAGFDGMWAVTASGGLHHTAEGSTFADGEWFALDNGDGPARIFSLRRLKYLGDFGLGERAPLTASADSAAVFTIEHIAAGPVAIKAPSGAWLGEFNGARAGIGGGKELEGENGGHDAACCWFPVFNEQAYYKNLPFYWNEGACRDEEGILTMNNAWADARGAAEDAIADALERGVSEEECAPLRELLDLTAAVHFGDADTDVAAIIEALAAAAGELGEKTAIEEIGCGDSQQDVKIFDLRGRRLSAPARGIYIIGEKKIFAR